MRIKEHALCPVCCKGVLEFYVPPFANGMVKEYCPVCAGEKHVRFPLTKIQSYSERETPCHDCGIAVPVIRSSGRKRKRCEPCKAKHMAAEQARWRKLNRERVNATRRAWDRTRAVA